MDLETVDFNNEQTPIIVTIAHINREGFKYCELFKIDNDLLLNNPKLALNNLWDKVFKYIILNGFKFIFIHNLGGFDGLPLYKALSIKYKPEEVRSIVDDKKDFIKVELRVNNDTICWLDSYRIFKVSLDELCKNFGVKGKLSAYNPDYNELTIFNNIELYNELLNYAVQDSIGLLEALLTAQKLYMEDFSIDITSILSTSTLSLKIFRAHFLDKEIPILKGSVDEFIRKSYLGGGTDYYKAYGKNLYYYDVNSLYPFAMCKPMPFEIIKEYKDMDLNLTIDSPLFGFFEADCIIPKTDRPALPYKFEGKTIHPTGGVRGVYFTEEMKALIKLGYKFKLLKGYEFSKVDLFSKYVEHFYNIKRNSSGSSRFIAKMHLNQLYGIFGRRQDLIETVNIYKKDLEKYLLSRVIKTYIEIDEDKLVLLLNTNIKTDILRQLNVEFTANFIDTKYDVKSNVAIAAAVTSYSRIHMLPFKTMVECVYTDTDSIFIEKQLSEDLIDKKELGLMKDEMDGILIDEAYFLGIKQYGYYYIDELGNRIEKSVFSGVPKNMISFKEITDLHNNKEINKTIPLRFYKSFKDLSITIKTNVKVNLRRSNEKLLINNKYLPIKVNQNNINSSTGKKHSLF